MQRLTLILILILTTQIVFAQEKKSIKSESNHNITSNPSKLSIGLFSIDLLNEYKNFNDMDRFYHGISFNFVQITHKFIRVNFLKLGFLSDNFNDIKNVKLAVFDLEFTLSIFYFSFNLISIFGESEHIINEKNSFKGTSFFGAKLGISIPIIKNKSYLKLYTKTDFMIGNDNTGGGGELGNYSGFPITIGFSLNYIVGLDNF